MSEAKQDINKVVLAYSGGLDTSVIVPWLRQTYDCEVVTFTADLGQSDEMDGLEAKALKTGASKVYVEDLREVFLTEYVFKAMRAGAIYERDYLLGTSFARPLIAKRMVEIAEIEHADAVAHGSTGKGNDQVRFEVSVMAINPKLKIITPWRHPDWHIRSREDAIAYAEKHHVPISHTLTSIYSRDENLFHMSHEGGPLENPWVAPAEDMFKLTASPQDAPDDPETIMIGFQEGNPISLDGEHLDPVSLFIQLNEIGAKHGIGRVDIVENRLVGIKSRGVYETPGGTILYKAHQALEQICQHKDLLHFKQVVGLRYADLIYNGKWFTHLRESLDAFVDETMKFMTGEVRLDLYKGNVIITGRRSPYSLYREDYASFGQMDVYDQSHAEGFITLWGLPEKVDAMISIDGTGKSRYQTPDYSQFKRD